MGKDSQRDINKVHTGWPNHITINTLEGFLILMPVTTRSTWLDLTCTCTSQYLEHTNIFSLKIQQPIPKQKILNFHKSYNFSQKPKSNKVTRVVKVGKFQIFRKVSGKVKNLEELNCQNKYVAHQLIPELPSFVCLFAIAFLRQKQYEGLKNLRKIECYIYILFSSSESPISPNTNFHSYQLLQHFHLQ